MGEMNDNTSLSWCRLLILSETYPKPLSPFVEKGSQSGHPIPEERQTHYHDFCSICQCSFVCLAYSSSSSILSKGVFQLGSGPSSLYYHPSKEVTNGAFTIDPTSRVPVEPPFPLCHGEVLAIHQGPFQGDTKKRAWQSSSPLWKELVDELAIDYLDEWHRLGIRDFIYVTTQLKFTCHNLVCGALQFWSHGCNSFIFPQGPMSITLRDVVAITGLPLSGYEVPSEMRAREIPVPNVARLTKILPSLPPMFRC